MPDVTQYGLGLNRCSCPILCRKVPQHKRKWVDLKRCSTVFLQHLTLDGCEHAILKRIQTGWLKFRELSGLLIGKGMSVKSKGIIYTTCIRPVMLYGSETWPTKVDDMRKMQRSEMRMLRWMTGVSLSERKSNECVRSMLAIDDVAEVMRRNRLRWFGHVERR